MLFACIHTLSLSLCLSFAVILCESKVFDKTSISIPCFYVETVCSLHNIVICSMYMYVRSLLCVCVCNSVCVRVLVFVYSMCVFLLLRYDILIA